MKTDRLLFPSNEGNWQGKNNLQQQIETKVRQWRIDQKISLNVIV